MPVGVFALALNVLCHPCCPITPTGSVIPNKFTVSTQCSPAIFSIPAQVRHPAVFVIPSKAGTPAPETLSVLHRHQFAR